MSALLPYVLALVCLGFPSLIIGVVLFSEPSGRDRSRDHNVIHGKWRVRYKDGALSEPMMKDVAEDYAEMFGGTVIPK